MTDEKNGPHVPKAMQEILEAARAYENASRSVDPKRHTMASVGLRVIEALAVTCAEIRSVRDALYKIDARNKPRPEAVPPAEPPRPGE